MEKTANLSIEGLRNVRAQTTALKDQYFPSINRKIAKFPIVGHYINTLTVRFGLSNTAFVLYFALTVAVLATWGLGTDTLCTIAGLVYPTLQTLKAREVEDFEQWISYWLIFTVLNVVQNNTYAFSWIPCFDGIKMGFLLFCMLPHTRGAEFVFHTFFKAHVVRKYNQEGEVSQNGRAESLGKKEK